jgi:chromatin assembly factor 1 subunit A
LIIIGPKKDTRSEYEAFFLPFHLTSHTRLPNNYFENFQEIEEDCNLNAEPALESLPQLPSSHKPRHHQLPLKDIMDILQGSSSQNPIDLTSDCSKQEYALQLLNDTPMKYLHFWEDVRPPYYGTWTKSLTAQQWRHLARNPFHQLDLFDYDYDSEAEWEEPEEGEDLNSDDEEEEDDEEDDMDEFLDDEEGAGNAPKRNLFSTDLVPNCSGLQWEDVKGNLQPAGEAEKVDFSELAMEFLLSMIG